MITFVIMALPRQLTMATQTSTPVGRHRHRAQTSVLIESKESLSIILLMPVNTK